LKTKPERRRILFYVQHLLGIGHLVRSVRICESLQRIGVDVTLVTGGLPVSGLPPSGLNHIELPAIAVRDGDFSSIVDSQGRLIDDEFRSKRCRQLLKAYQSIKPDLVVLEAFPFGRRQLRFELLPLLKEIKNSQRKPILVTSIRDFLQRRTKPGRDEYVIDLIDNYFDKVLVHGDPGFATLLESFPKAELFRDKIEYTGLVCSDAVQKSSEQYDVIVSAGGGAVGDQLMWAAVEASKLLPGKISWCVITGPNSPLADRLSSVEHSGPNVRIEQFRSDFPSLLKSAKLSVSQAGYNTVGDILKARCKSLLVPYSAHGETEQNDRAIRLQKLGVADVLHSEELTGEKLAHAVHQLLEGSGNSTRFSIDTNGAAKSADILLAWINGA